MVTRAVERHYEGLLGEAGASGYEYLDKIVQIPFRIPTPETHEVEAFLSELLGNPHPSFPTTSVSTSMPADLDSVSTPGFPSQTPVEAPPPMDPEASTDGEISGFTYYEFQAFRNLSPFLKPNPRHLKRLVNIYRLIRTLVEKSGLRQKPGPIICWVALCAQWPYAAYLMLRHFEDLLKKWSRAETFRRRGPSLCSLKPCSIESTHGCEESWTMTPFSSPAW